MVNISGYVKESINEGLGLRSVINFSGCRHFCEGCFAHDSWDFNHGLEFTKTRRERVIKNVKDNPLIDGISLLGGDPFFSAKDVMDFVKEFRTELPNKNVWAYTGFTYEQILESGDPAMLGLLNQCDVLVDGRFEEENKDLTLKFVGSTNQRIIDVQKALQNNKIVLYKL